MSHQESQETPFKIDETFVSLTDKKSTILAVNDTFVRIAGYSYDDIIGAPHNLIRHPDMPKSIFKIFWNAIQGNEPISAYVKNKSLDGRYYWVFATTWPTETGYMSVRTKPCTTYFNAIPKLYSELIHLERQKGIPAALEALQQFLTQIGFESYQKFAQAALNREFEQRMLLTKDIPRKEPIHQSPHLSIMHRNIRQSLTETAALMHRNVQLKGLTDALHKHTESLQKQVQHLDTLSLNMAVSSTKFGQLGLPLTVVSAEFQLVSKRLIKNYQMMLDELPKLTDALAAFRRSIGIVYLQAELLDVYLQEASLTIHTPSGFKRFWQESSLFISMMQSRSLGILQDISSKEQMLLQFERWMTSLHHELLSLDLCRLGGSVESMREEAIEAKFRPFVSRLTECIRIMETPLLETRERITQYKALFQDARARVQSLQVGLVGLEMTRLRFEDTAANPT